MKKRVRGERFLLLQRICLPDQQGGYTEEWQERGHYWAFPENRSGKTYLNASLEGNKEGTLPLKSSLYKVSARIELPRNFDHFIWKGRRFSVITPFEETRLGWISFFASEVRPSAQTDQNILLKSKEKKTEKKKEEEDQDA